MSFLFIRQSCFAADNIKMKLIDHLERKKINLVLSRLLIFGVVFSILSVCVYFRSLLWSYFQFYFHFRFHHLLEHYKNSRRWREMATPWLIERERKKISNKLLQLNLKRAKEKLQCIHINHVCYRKITEKLFRRHRYCCCCCQHRRRRHRQCQCWCCCFALLYSRSLTLSTYRWEVKRFSLECVQCTYGTFASNRTYLHHTNLNKLLRFFLFRVSWMCVCVCASVSMCWCCGSICMLNGYAKWILYCVSCSLECSTEVGIFFVSFSSLAIFFLYFARLVFKLWALKISVRIVL